MLCMTSMVPDPPLWFGLSSWLISLREPLSFKKYLNWIYLHCLIIVLSDYQSTIISVDEEVKESGSGN